MSHELHIEDGRASLMYVGQEPWHGLGQELDGPATAEEAIRAANLDWEVMKQPLYACSNGLAYRVKGKFAVVPTRRWGADDCPIFGIVGAGYKPLQNREAFQFFDPIAGKGAAIYHTAGALGRGERVWILAKLPETIRVADQDITEKYLLFSNSHDGTSSVQIKFTPIRVVCCNTLTMALSKGPTIRVAHTRNLKERLDQARRTLKLIGTHYQKIEEAFLAMVKVKMDQSRLSEYMHRVFPDPRDPEDERAVKRVKHSRARATHLFEHAATS